MTREELKEHCKKQIEMCEFWAKARGENPCGKIYEEHKLILKLLEQEPVLDKIRAEIKQLPDMDETGVFSSVRMKSMVLDILDKYKIEGEE